ncbi:hypothetical protein PL71_15070 [Pseudoalteromonas distincta]|uniref:DUF2787 family protein n=1 Tax=Pseudoalteromonas distincta TaxID=77608 RepID=A0ABT9GC10_9GAMM|nr:MULTISPECIES: DUF2787 family protein [Pseudoalteromonas distincta group]KHM46195.1 hypothetical protein PL71_15070 [Pseudoalteromonas elyakovii]KID37010.1 hypothetical protein QT16_13395 [Pseudoalteromonas distincta]MDP4483372.1 DUF2787 family protein [Pseudoalteromonas elyakovii]
MALKIEQVSGLKVPDSFISVIVSAITNRSDFVGEAKAVTLNFRDPDYSPEAGGFHSVEVKLEKQATSWQLVYITDFSYQGRYTPELIKEIDVCFSIKQVYHFLAGWLNAREGEELLALFISNFVEYYNTGCYQVMVTTE